MADRRREACSEVAIDFDCNVVMHSGSHLNLSSFNHWPTGTSFSRSALQNNRYNVLNSVLNACWIFAWNRVRLNSGRYFPGRYLNRSFRVEPTKGVTLYDFIKRHRLPNKTQHLHGCVLGRRALQTVLCYTNDGI